MHLQSLSTIVRTALLGSSSVRPNGNELLIIETVNVSLASEKISSIIGISNGAQVVPAGNVISNVTFDTFLPKS